MRPIWSPDGRELIYAAGRPTNDPKVFYGDPPGERPADLGYFVGYRIVEAYYQRAADRRAAIREILTATDYEALLAASGYDP